jgi:hypothetical protein
MQGKLKVAIEDFETSAQIALREENDTALYDSSIKEVQKILNSNKSSSLASYIPPLVADDYPPPAMYYPPLVNEIPMYDPDPQGNRIKK